MPPENFLAFLSALGIAGITGGAGWFFWLSRRVIVMGADMHGINKQMEALTTRDNEMIEHRVEDAREHGIIEGRLNELSTIHAKVAAALDHSGGGAVR